MPGYTVFNVEQIEGLPEHYYLAPPPPAEETLIESAEALYAAKGATFRHGGHRAFHAPAQDVIHLPPAEAFRDGESYAAVKAHELTHWTDHPARLDRALSTRFGDEAYEAEELIAETGSAFLCADLGVTVEPAMTM